MRVALYHRVSTLDQDPALAREELHAAAARMGTIVADVEETGSGAKNNRPGLAEVMAAVRARKVDAVVVWKLDRFGRSALDLLANVRELQNAGCRFIATTQGLDTAGGATSQLILTVLAGVAEFERELIRERTTLGMAKARKEGKTIGRPRVLASEMLLARARELRALADRPEIAAYTRPRSWRAVAGMLKTDGFQNVPNHATLARLCTKPYAEIGTAPPREPPTSESSP